MSQAVQHIDPKRFTALFRGRDPDRNAIVRTLYRLCHHAARGFNWPSEQDKEDGGSDAAVHCFERIDRFDVNRPGANAHAYFSRVAMRQLAVLSSASLRRRSRFVALPDGGQS